MKEEEIKKALDKTNYEPLSAFLDFYSDRATAHASFLVAAVFGLFSVLYLIKGESLITKVILSVIYWILWSGGYFSLFNFNHYAMKAHDIKRMISQKQPLLRPLEEHFEQEREETGLYSSIRSKILAFKNSELKLPIINTLYICVGILPWLYVAGILSWLFDRISLINSVQTTALTTSQTLIILGLVFEFLSVVISVRKLFSGYYDRLQKGTFREQIRKERIEGSLFILFLIIGMALQILGLQV